jgi:zinc transport system ATP-binding protein
VSVRSQVELEGVGFRHGDVAVLEGINLAVGPGDFLGIIGPNGSGKTTLLRVILGLAPPATGTVRLFGKAPATFREWGRLGYVPQRATFDPSLPATVAEVVNTGLGAALGWFRRAGADGRRRVREALQQVGMDAHLGARVSALSIGQQQRVLIARALVSEPELLILDEPTGGIDPDAQEAFYALLRHLNRERAVTLILVSHDIGVIAREVKTLACLNRRLIFHGRPADFMTDAALAALYGPSVRVVSHQHH